MQRGHASRPTPTLGEVHMPLQGQALKTPVFCVCFLGGLRLGKDRERSLFRSGAE